MMENKKSTIEKIKSALSHAPLEIHSNIVYEACRINIARIDHNCSQLVSENALGDEADKRLKAIDDIYFNLDEIKNILWAAVESSKTANNQKNSNPEG